LSFDLREEPLKSKGYVLMDPASLVSREKDPGDRADEERERALFL
jgi:hypothetical protein